MWDSKIVRYLSGALTAMTISGCTLLLGLGDKQCSTNAECVDSQLGDMCVDNVCQLKSYDKDGGKGCEADRDCSGTSTPRCLRNYCVTSDVYSQWMCPAQTPAITDTVKYSFKVVEYLSRKPPANLKVNACRLGDAMCASPVASFTDVGKTGNVVLTLENGFQGYFEVLSDHLTALLYVTRAVVTDTENRDVPVLESTTVAGLAGLAGLPYDDSKTKGVALLEMIDCSGKPASGVRFESNRNAPDRFYIINGVPSKDAKQTLYDGADSTGDGGFLNLEKGLYTFTAYLGVEEDAPQLGQFIAQIRMNTITYVDLSF
ncbi:MAG TPA: hypothetical protein VFN67_16660 [Polyangiales bacterium]|nr:hypothetical protein [Polyangiales bacterium]